MKQLIKRVLRKPYNCLRILFKVRWCKTIRLNFTLLPFKKALKLPIIVTGKLIIDSLKGGHVEIDAPLHFGMINFGRDIDNMPIATCKSRVMINGKVTFKGHCILNQSVNLCVWHGAHVEIGHCVIIASGILLKSAHNIVIGDYTRIASGSFIMDTNVHTVKDTETGRIARNYAPIIIGSRCWLTMNTSVTAGAVIPDYSITARGSLINKDFSKDGTIGLMLGGSPAKVLKTGVRRQFDYKIEQKVNKYFLENPDAMYYQDKPGFDEPEEIEVVKQFTIY